ncbi:holo-ACP synthase [Rhodocyclus gracilis]|uniref:Holo-[acyl-carrier-protein] synthase n=1 Tax=Rhodocyclus tenuis TaxID=1066 RepID=A0A6L5JUH2_RHOTE|nr:holo-ACP synthase [Rhodocyclus gracilis]MQY50869.1 holo-ACP synthase [Rhodocyclus gracilis]
MIAGVGTDIAAVARLAGLWERHGERALEKMLAPEEFADFAKASDPGRFLAKRFAAKEAFAKALGTGVVAPATLPNIAVIHDALGKPAFAFAPALRDQLEARGLRAFLSISDEREFAVAFVVLEYV